MSSVSELVIVEPNIHQLSPYIHQMHHDPYRKATLPLEERYISVVEIQNPLNTVTENSTESNCLISGGHRKCLI